MKYRLIKKIRCIIDAVGNVIFPPRCALCDDLLEPGQRGIHPKCRGLIYEVTGPLCLHCGRPVISERTEYCFDCARNKSFVQSFRQGKALYLYKGEIKKSLYRFKYAGRREYAAFFAEETMKKYSEWIQMIAPDMIMPIPMYEKKRRKRGYNQAETYAKALSVTSGIPENHKILLRVKDTVPQKLLNDTERKNNLKNAFQTSENIVKYRKILLVDDIYTTGSTAEAATECLRKSGVSEVYFLSICIGKGN